MKERNFIGNVIIEIMADGGQGFFKICMSVLPEEFTSESYYEVENLDLCEESNLPSKKGFYIQKAVVLLAKNSNYVACID